MCSSDLLSLTQGTEEVHFAMVGNGVTRQRTDEGFRMVVPLEAGEEARLYISTRPDLKYDSASLRPREAEQQLEGEPARFQKIPRVPPPE